MLRQASSDLSKAWQEFLWDGGGHHGDAGVVPSLNFPATQRHGQSHMVLTGGTSPGESAPIPGVVRRFLQQDMYHLKSAPDSMSSCEDYGCNSPLPLL